MFYNTHVCLVQKNVFQKFLQNLFHVHVILVVFNLHEPNLEICKHQTIPHSEFLFFLYTGQSE